MYLLYKKYTSFSKFVCKTTEVITDLTFDFKSQGLGHEALKIWKMQYNRVEGKSKKT